MPQYQQITVVGHLGKDPECKAVGDNLVAKFSIAVGEKWKDKNGEQKEHTEWFNIEAWGAQARYCHDYVRKGDPLMVVGTVRTDVYTDKDGQEKRWVKVKAQKVVGLGGKRGANAGPTDDDNNPPPPNDDDVPF